MATTDKELEKTTPAGALARPSFIEDSTDGTEGIEREDIKLPRLAIAQGLSPQMIPGEPAHIPGLVLFDFFNDLTGEKYRSLVPGVKPLQFVVGRRDVKFIEFDPNDRKVPIDLEVPRHDARTKWGKDENGKGTPPRATKFVEFVVLLIHDDGRVPEPVVISIQETNKWNKKAHERLSGFIKMGQPPSPIYAKIYSATPSTGRNDKGTFGVFQMDQVGFIQDETLYKVAKKFHGDIKEKKIDLNRESDPDSFDPEELERTGGAGGM